ncbi:MAG: hypothetical protein DME19_11385 [Verrucomicrobia bacterium]|nr:MAG: hypothetical protein DME19_11385 [Verrucomicrobiota bacterium]
MEESDAVAVAKAREGDQDAFRVLVERHSLRLFQLAYRMTGNEQDAEDMVQETFLRAYNRLDRFESRAGFGTWLHRIAANCSLDLLRRQKRRGDRERTHTCTWSILCHFMVGLYLRFQGVTINLHLSSGSSRLPSSF